MLIKTEQLLLLCWSWSKKLSFLSAICLPELILLTLIRHGRVSFSFLPDWAKASHQQGNGEAMGCGNADWGTCDYGHGAHHDEHHDGKEFGNTWPQVVPEPGWS